MLTTQRTSGARYNPYGLRHVTPCFLVLRDPVVMPSKSVRSISQKKHLLSPWNAQLKPNSIRQASGPVLCCICAYCRRCCIRTSTCSMQIVHACCFLCKDLLQLIHTHNQHPYMMTEPASTESLSYILKVWWSVKCALPC